MTRVDIEALSELLRVEQHEEALPGYVKRAMDEWYAPTTYLRVCEAAHDALPAILAELRAARAVLSLCPREAEWSPEEPFCEAVRAYDEVTGKDI